MSRRREMAKDRRTTRALLGLCSDCTEPCVNGLSRCARHVTMHTETGRRAQERKVRARGFRYERVPIVQEVTR